MAFGSSHEFGIELDLRIAYNPKGRLTVPIPKRLPPAVLNEDFLLKQPVFLVIYQPQGAEIAGAIGNLANWVFDRMTLPVTGTYTILVDPDSSFTGSVTFTIYEVASDVTGTIAIGGSPVTVTTTVPGQNGVLTFSGTAGEQVSLATSNATASGTVTLRNTYGTALDSTASAPFNGFVETHTLPATGTYSVLVDPSGSSTGSVTVKLYDRVES